MSPFSSIASFFAGQQRTDKEAIAKMLKLDPSKINEFEAAYKQYALDAVDKENLFAVNAKQAAELKKEQNSGAEDTETCEELVSRIVSELLAQTEVLKVRNGRVFVPKALPEPDTKPVTNADLSWLPKEIRPQLTGSLMKIDIEEPAFISLLEMLNLSKTSPSAKVRAKAYQTFRWGLDTLDLDPVTYAMLGMNPNSMGNWLPQITAGVGERGFFRIPDTTVIKVPLTLLQLTRVDYSTLTPTTLRIVDEFCHRIFELDDEKDYFIKTGTYSSKFDFRNAHVHGAKEVQELGEYLLYIHYQALLMASPLVSRPTYGVSTTNEWVVREFIPDVEGGNSVFILKGLPLRTEFRVFVDFDTDEILGISPYWEPEMLKKRFSQEDDKDSPHMMHDYIIIKSYEDVLNERYEKNKDKVLSELQKIIPYVDLPGQWSVDIMQNGDTFWLIDMALAANSALVNCVPKEKLRRPEENWIPELSE